MVLCILFLETFCRNLRKRETKTEGCLAFERGFEGASFVEKLFRGHREVRSNFYYVTSIVTTLFVEVEFFRPPSSESGKA